MSFVLKKIRTTVVVSTVVFLCIFFLSGCGRKKITYETSKNIETRATTIKNLLQECEAKLADIPVPLDSQAVAHHADEVTADNVMLSYTNEMSASSVAQFYEREMERCGWRADVAYAGKESLLAFSKPTRFCSISIRPRYDVRKRVAAEHGVGIFIVTGPLQVDGLS